MFQKILIANRGEIACRVMLTARKMGISTVAVYSEADAHAPHMRLADEAVFIGPAPATQSYLVADKILGAARQTGAEAIHPGYGFLSENADFAQACEDAGVIFIGPTPQTIRAMGSKAAAKDLIEAAGVPTSPGYQGEDQSIDTFRKEAARIGYPVLLKAVAGGGGKGMRLVEKAGELEDALSSARREAQSAFGDDRFLVEKYIRGARHLEVQIFGDGKGNVVHFYERDCSVQRRHQKIIEEAPAPNLGADIRQRLLDAGVAAGKAVNYRGAGTVEFLYDGGENIYFMEMNTRLQVEHPVSEEITGTDLVEWQLRVSAGEPLPAAQDQITETGHAFEARLYAEDPAKNFAPSIGTLTTLQLAEGVPGVRLDSGVCEGQTITPFYDPMIAKIITHGATRKQALGKMRNALAGTKIAGLETNAGFLHALTREPDFINGNVSTRFIEDHADHLFKQGDIEHPAIAAWILWQRRAYKKDYAADNSPSSSPWNSLTGWRLNRAPREVFWMLIDGEAASVNLTSHHDHHIATIEPGASAKARREGREPHTPATLAFSGNIDAHGHFDVTIDKTLYRGTIAPHLERARIWINGHTHDITSTNPLEGHNAQAIVGGNLSAPMPGTVTALIKKPGDMVEAGETLMVMEAMKMEHAIKAPSQGTIKAFRFDIGQQVSEGDLLVEFESTED